MPNPNQKCINFYSFYQPNSKKCSLLFHNKNVKIISSLLELSEHFCLLEPQPNLDIYFFCHYDDTKEIEGTITDFNSVLNIFFVSGYARYIPFFYSQDNVVFSNEDRNDPIYI